MAQDIGLDIEAAGTEPTMPTADVVDGTTSTLIGSVDFGLPLPLEIAYEWIQACLASAIDFAYLQVMWSHDDMVFSDPANYETVATLQCAASQDVEQAGSFPCRARFAKFQIENQAGGALDFTAANSKLEFRDAFGDQA